MEETVIVKKNDLKLLYNAFEKICDYMECEVGCGECPLWSRTCHAEEAKWREFVAATERIRKAL